MMTCICINIYTVYSPETDHVLLPTIYIYILARDFGIPSRYSLAFSADGRWLFSMCAEERKGSKGRNELSATTSPLCAWKLGRLDDARVKAGITGQPRSPHLRLAMKEKVRLVPHPEDWQSADVSAGEVYGTCPAFAILCAHICYN